MNTPARRVRLGQHDIVAADDQPTFWDRVEAGRWEPGTLAALTPLLGPGVAFLDIGAWVGPLSLLAAARGARVVAIEADPAAQDQFRRNLAANPDLGRRIELVEAAISPDEGEVRLGARRKRGDSMSSVLLADGPGAWTAPAVTPAILAARVGQADRLVIKIDIEGAEYALLPHLGPLLDRPEVAILLSLHPVILAQAGVADLDAALRSALAPFAGWRAYRIDDAGPADRGAAPGAVLSEPDHETWLMCRSSC